MFPRRKSLTTRVLETVPVFVIAGLGISGVVVAMTVLVTAVPAGYDLPSPSPSVSAKPSPSATRAVSPSIVPTVAYSPPVTTAPVPSERPVVINSAIKAKDPGGVWQVYLLYPSFKEGITPWAQSINAEIKAEMDALATKFEAGPATERQAPGKVNSLSSVFTKDLVTPQVTSFTLIWTDDTFPGYPDQAAISLNYDMGTGQSIAFGDIFTDYQTALVLFSQQVPALLESQLGFGYDRAMVEQGTFPLLANYPNWGLTPAGLKLTFPPDAVAPAAKGFISVVVPWSVLKPIMVPTGPVAQLAGF